MQLHSVQPSFSAFLNSLVILSLTLLLAACGGGGGGGSDGPSSSNRTSGSPPTSPARTITLEGVAMKGAIANGLITVYGTEEHASYHQLTADPLAQGVRTNEDGSFQVEFTPKDSEAWVVQLTADEHTTMTCDLPDGCQDGQGSKVGFGSRIKVPDHFEMYAAIINNATLNQTAHITPLTHLAYQWSAQRVDGLTAANIATGRELIANSLGLTSTILDLKPLDVTRLSGHETVDVDALDYSILSASFLDLAQGQGWKDINQVLEAASQRFATWGQFPETSPLHTEVSLQTILRSTSGLALGIANRLQPLHPDSALQSQLKGLAYASSQLAKELESVAQAPVVIQYHPGSQTVVEQESVTFNVNADGGGPLRYQWRKNGKAIPGATSSTLTLSSVRVEDAGSYDCVISNKTSSALSKAATLTVKPAHITLVWEIPQQRVDGTPLHPSELNGYRILYGTRADQLTQTLQIKDPYAAEQRFENLPKNTYYFSILAIDDQGNESALSNVVEATL